MGKSYAMFFITPVKKIIIRISKPKGKIFKAPAKPPYKSAKIINFQIKLKTPRSIV